MNIDHQIPPKQLVTIIRSLLSFIIIDGKKFIDPKHEQAYIQKYLYKLSTSVNGISQITDMNKLMAQIEKDIAQYSKNEVSSKWPV